MLNLSHLLRIQDISRGYSLRAYETINTTLLIKDGEVVHEWYLRAPSMLEVWKTIDEKEGVHA